MIKKNSNKKNGNNGKSNNSFVMISDDKLKPLIPTLRQKKRFVKIGIEGFGSKKLDFKEISEGLLSEVMYYVGAIDFGKCGFWILKDKFDFDKQEVVFKVGLEFKDKVIGALALINKVGNNDVKIKVLRVSGTLKGLHKKD